jgi:hypothetical protein
MATNPWRALRDSIAKVQPRLIAKALKDLIERDPAALRDLDLDLIRRLVIDDKQALDMLDEALQRPPHLHHSGRPAPSGNSIEAALRRLRKDPRPLARALRGKVLSGEMSAHAAAIQAGYRKRPS